jgi:hypothetical protein
VKPIGQKPGGAELSGHALKQERITAIPLSMHQYLLLTAAETARLCGKMNTYTMLGVMDEATAVEALPTVPGHDSRQRATAWSNGLASIMTLLRRFGPKRVGTSACQRVLMGPERQASAPAERDASAQARYTGQNVRSHSHPVRHRGR